MTPRFLPQILVIAAGCASPPAPAPRAADLVVPPMPSAAPSPTKVVKVKEATMPEPTLSYEEALARAVDEPSAPPADEPDMTDAQLMAPMRNATFISECGAPDAMKVVVKVAVRRGRAAGVTIRTEPANETVARCVDGRVRELRWPARQKMDSFTSTY